MPHDRSESGNALIVALIVCIALGGLSAAFLGTSLRESDSNQFSEQRTRIFYVAEAGVTHAVSQILADGEPNLGSKEAPIAFGGGSYYVKTVALADGAFAIRSFAELNHQRRGIEVIIAPEDVPLFQKALFGDLDLGATGDVFTDAYDSRKGPYWSQAVHFDPHSGRLYAEPEGDLGSNRNIMLRGGVTVLGDATPGPGYTVSISGAQVYVQGSTAPAQATLPLPPLDYDPPIASGGSYNAVADENSTVSAGVYRFVNLNVGSKSVIHFQGDVVLYVDDRFDVTALGQLIVNPGSTLTIYHGGEDFNLTGHGVINATGQAGSLRIFSSATDVKYAGTSSFYGAIYAPNATITPIGTTAIFGSFVGRQVSVGGTTDFHYDAALREIDADNQKRYRRVSWRYLPLNADEEEAVEDLPEDVAQPL